MLGDIKTNEWAGRAWEPKSRLKASGDRHHRALRASMRAVAHSKSQRTFVARAQARRQQLAVYSHVEGALALRAGDGMTGRRGDMIRC
jgi:hypothetical protein